MSELTAEQHREKVIFVCVRVEEMPEAGVPSRRERCKDCGAEVWMSAEIKADGYVCVECALESHSIRLQKVPHPQVREKLRAQGWTDEEIERAHEIATVAMGPRREG